MKHRIDVLVAGSGNVTGQGVLAALTDAGVTCAGYDQCEEQANAANMFCDNLQAPRAADPFYQHWVMGLVYSMNPRVIIPSNDHDLRALLNMTDELSKRGIVVNGAGDYTGCFLDKLSTSKLFTEYSIDTPEVLETQPYKHPYVIRKRHVGVGRKFTYVAKNLDDDDAIPWNRLHECVATRFVEGQEYTIDILCNQSSQVLSVVPRLRRQVTAGIVTFAEVVKDDLVIEKCHHLATSLGLRGINCVQCIKNDKGAYFFEVNPRPGSGLSLTTAAGVNMPKLWLDSLSDDVVGVPEPDWGLKMVRYHAGRYFK